MTPKRFAVLGDPIAHSRSPAMHAAAYRALEMPHTYEAIQTTQAELAARVAALRAGTFDGFNVTLPHKSAVLAHVDAIDESARIAGAANTLVRSPEGTIRAHNTDARALADEIAQLSPDVSRGAIVLGSGGAARSAVVALAVHLGVPRIVVRARSFEDAAARDAFARSFGSIELTLEAWRPSEETDRYVAIVVQATSAGMTGRDAGDVANVIAWDALATDACALDVIYTPRDTPFLGAARGRGIRSADGIGMLARQGALAFELWLGVAAPLDAMLAAIT